MNLKPLSSRRSLLATTGAVLFSSAFGQTGSTSRLRATPAQTEGPFYPVSEPRDADGDLLKNGSLAYAKGEPAWVRGVVTDLEGQPLKGGVIEIWQCDEAGHYDHPGDGSRSDPAFQGFGRVTLTANGEFRFRTIKPVPYSGRTAHIHAKVKLGKTEVLTTQLYVAGEPGNARDFVWRRLSVEERGLLTVPFVRVADGLQASYALAIAG